jgi:hypothetical protein
MHSQGGSVIVERSVWVCLLRGITKEREREREREREFVCWQLFRISERWKKRGEIKMNFSKKDTSQEEETTDNYPAAMSNLHVCACEDLFSFFTTM